MRRFFWIFKRAFDHWHNGIDVDGLFAEKRHDPATFDCNTKHDELQRSHCQSCPRGYEKGFSSENEGVEKNMARKMTADTKAHFDALLQLIARLRAEDGCPWDRKQTPHTLAAYLIEEMYELVEAITADDTDAICEELGDLLFQILFLAVLYQEQGCFTLNESLAQIRGKMIRRHPHVFGDAKVDSAREVKQRWRQIKKREKGDSHSLLASVPTGMPALMRAYRISERAAGIGFDWENLSSVMAQAELEWNEFKDEINRATTLPDEQNADAAMELGDVLFSLVNVARLAGIHPERSLIRSIQKFIGRFQRMESMAAEQKRDLEAFSRQDLERMWKRAKDGEKQ
jgi:tetrapyrrole methylase family protein/MazG family protein